MVMIMGGILFLAGCDLQSSSSDSTSGTNTDTGTPPPSQLVGTAALAGESATYTLTPASSPSSSVIGRKALYTVSGNIRYRGTDFSVTGTYESVTRVISVTSASVSLSGQTYSFKIMGTYSVTEGFNGTIERYVNGVKDLVGSVTGKVPAQGSLAKNYLGTFSGGAGGTWNFTIQGSTFTGTYANYDPEAGNGTFSGTISGSTLTITTVTNSVFPVVSFSGQGTISATSISGTWRTTLTTEEGSATYSGVWSGAAATTQGDPHTPSSADPLDYKFSLILQAIDLALVSTGYDPETQDTYQNSANSVQCVVTENDPSAGKNKAVMTMLSDFTDPVRGIVLNAGGTITSIYQMPAGDLLKVTATISFGNSPIATLSMDVDVDKQARSISGTITIDGTPVTDISVLKNFFF